MLKFLGENYYIDINELESQVTIVDNTKIVLSGETKNEDQDFNLKHCAVQSLHFCSIHLAHFYL